MRGQNPLRDLRISQLEKRQPFKSVGESFPGDRAEGGIPKQVHAD